MRTNRKTKSFAPFVLVLHVVVGYSFVCNAGADETEDQMNVGGRSITVADNAWGGPFPVLVVYPTSSRPAAVELGPYTFDLAWNAPVSDGVHPLVLISHGTGGTHLGYRLLAAHLARNGYVVVMPEHPGNNRNNDELAGTTDNLVNRPRHVSLAIDAVAADAHFRDAVVATEFSVIGHSMGGYTALAVAGATPSEAPGEPVPVERDERVTHVVLMAPATAWFQGEGALAEIDVPILIFSGEEDDVTPLWHAEVVLDGLPETADVEHRIVENAGHFSFMSPFPESMQDPAFLPSQDPPGFDRESFQRELGIEILEFLARR